MKKLMVFILAAAMVFGVAGTALAQNTVELNVDSGVSNVYWDAVFATAPGGASIFVAGGEVWTEVTDKAVAGTTLYAISNTLTNANGTELRSQALKFDSGATPLGVQLVSGTSDTVIFYVQAAYTDTVGDGPYSGGTIYSINGGTGAVYWTRAVEITGFAVPGTLDGPIGGVFENANTGASSFCTAPLTIDTESYTDTLGGATIFGVSGASLFGTDTDSNGGPNSGVSIWALDANTGAYATTSAGNSNVTAFGINESYSGVSVVHAAPVISGDSLFIVGYSMFDAGMTIYQFVKNDLLAGVSAQALVNANMIDTGEQWIPTPTVSGGSIFVVDNDGGVSAFRAADLALQYSVLYRGADIDAGVTASPVTDGAYIVLCSTSSITAYNLNTLSGDSKEWTYSFGANKSIWGTPSISNGYVWVTVNDTVALTATTYRFLLTDTYDGSPSTVKVHGNLVFASPIVANEDVWTVTYNPTVEKIAQTNIARGEAYWPQFKFDAAKTGHNTRAAVQTAADTGTDDSGCFISTIK